MSLEPNSFDQMNSLKQVVLRRKYSGLMVDGTAPLHVYYQNLGDMASLVPIVEPPHFKGRDRSDLESDAASKRMLLEMTVRAGLDEIALIPTMVIRTPSLQKDQVASIMSQAEEALKRR